MRSPGNRRTSDLGLLRRGSGKARFTRLAQWKRVNGSNEDTVVWPPVCSLFWRPAPPFLLICLLDDHPDGNAVSTHLACTARAGGCGPLVLCRLSSLQRLFHGIECVCLALSCNLSVCHSDELVGA